MTDAAGSEAWSYDKMGRVWTDQRTTNSLTKNTIHAYDLAGNVTSLTNPSGRVLTYSYDTAARALSTVDTPNSINYALNATYAPTGALASVQNGGSLYSTFLFNKRLQPCWLYATTSSTGAPSSCTQTGVANASILDYQYDFGLGVADNGNVNKITNRITPGRSVTYTYDELNRIKEALTDGTTGANCWGQLFGTMVSGNYVSGYDIWGNLNTISADPARPGCSVNTLSQLANLKNQVSGDTYDAAGNLTSGTGFSGLSYNAENQLATASGVTYTYDGDGKRVKKSSGKLYWYGAGSDALNESDATGSITDEYVFFNGKRIARRHIVSGQPDAISYYFADHLGTARVITNAAGTVLDDSDFYPFGGERVVTSSSGNAYKFTSKERDSESGLDDFDARYYSSSMGRFMTPDWSATPEPVPYANFTNPQTLNLYAIVADNPTTFADLDGHCFSTTEVRACGGCESGQALCAQAQTDKPPTPLVAQSDPPQEQQKKPDQPPPSWDPKKPLPDDPSKLGPDWKLDPGHKAPNDDRYVNPEGDKMDWHKGQPGERGEKGKDHWHWLPGGKKQDRHYYPGDTVKKVAIGVVVIGAAVAVIHTIVQTAPYWVPALAF